MLFTFLQAQGPYIEKKLWIQNPPLDPESSFRLLQS